MRRRLLIAGLVAAVLILAAAGVVLDVWRRAASAPLRERRSS
jgi:hypothetical protein